MQFLNGLFDPPQARFLAQHGERLKERRRIFAPADGDTDRRAYLRELTVWSKMIDEGMGLEEAQRQTEGITVASLTARYRCRCRQEAQSDDPYPTKDPNCLVLTRSAPRPGDVDFAAISRQRPCRTSDI